MEILASRMSYYPGDLAVIGWNAAFIYDTQSGAETAIQLLQYANSQLLEFRHYDELLTKELENVYDFLEVGGTGWWSRWRTAKAASKLHTVLLDVNELTERADNAIKFLSDMFSARLYKLCAQKVGVPDYKDLVQEKLHTAEDLYRFMVEQFNQSRAFVLELMVVVILIIELVYFFKGKM
jgi:maltodextrin utilization protein YvdJ